MIKLIAGPKGSGKTKRMIDMANEAAAVSEGSVVFLTDTERYMMEISSRARKINMSKFKGEDGSLSIEQLLGFVQGILAGNNDIDTLLVDGAHRLCKKAVAEMEDFYKGMIAVAEDKPEVVIIMTVSEERKKLPPVLQAIQE